MWGAIVAAVITVSPGESIQAAIDAAQSGDEIVVEAGSYEGTLQTVRDGTADQPITLRSDGGEVIATASGRVLRVDHAYFVVEGLVLDGQYGDRIALAVSGDGFVLRDAEVRRSGRDCVDLADSSGVLIERSAIHHCLNSTGGRTDAHGGTGGAVQDLTIRDSEIFSFSGDAV